ncbi:MAG TPA: hypothetical protein VLM85_11610 [Polyangiaceae bacterium]|nr:hypothetical protein [Polyangiaceae bacterium]
MKGLRAFASVVVAVSASAPAWAQQPHDPVAAEALFREGRAAADAGNLTDACPKFKASYGLDPAPGTLFNLADCEERVGQLAAAWQHFHQLLDQLPASDDRRPYVQTHSQQIEPRVPRLRVVLAAGAPPGTEVVRDGEPLAAALLGVAVPVDPGAHRLVVHAPDRVDKVYELSLAEKDQQDLEVTVGPVVPRTVAPPKPVVVHVPPPPKRAPPLRTVGFVVGGVGLVSAAVGAVFGGLALSDNGESNASCQGSVCSSQQAVDLHERAKTEALVADISIFGGVALVAMGAVFVLASRRAEMHVVPTVGTSGAGLVLVGAF